MNENLNWQKKDKLDFTKIVDQIGDLSKEVVKKEIKEVASKIEMLHKMGLIKDEKEFLEMKNKLKNLKLEEK